MPGRAIRAIEIFEGIHRSTSNSALKAAFDEFGIVEEADVGPPSSIVRFQSEEAAEKAIAACEKGLVLLEGTKLKVREARRLPPPPPPPPVRTAEGDKASEPRKPPAVRPKAAPRAKGDGKCGAENCAESGRRRRPSRSSDAEWGSRNLIKDVDRRHRNEGSWTSRSRSRSLSRSKQLLSASRSRSPQDSRARSRSCSRSRSLSRSRSRSRSPGGQRRPARLPPPPPPPPAPIMRPVPKPSVPTPPPPVQPPVRRWSARRPTDDAEGDLERLAQKITGPLPPLPPLAPAVQPRRRRRVRRIAAEQMSRSRSASSNDVDIDLSKRSRSRSCSVSSKDDEVRSRGSRSVSAKGAGAQSRRSCSPSSRHKVAKSGHSRSRSASRSASRSSFESFRKAAPSRSRSPAVASIALCNSDNSAAVAPPGNAAAVPNGHEDAPIRRRRVQDELPTPVLLAESVAAAEPASDGIGRAAAESSRGPKKTRTSSGLGSHEDCSRSPLRKSSSPQRRSASPRRRSVSPSGLLSPSPPRKSPRPLRKSRSPRRNASPRRSAGQQRFVVEIQKTPRPFEFPGLDSAESELSEMLRTVLKGLPGHDGSVGDPVLTSWRLDDNTVIEVQSRALAESAARVVDGLRFFGRSLTAMPLTLEVNLDGS